MPPFGIGAASARLLCCSGCPGRESHATCQKPATRNGALQDRPCGKTFAEPPKSGARAKGGFRPVTELVIFDCDGVLIDSEGLSGAVLIAALADLGLIVDFDYFCTNFVGRSFPTVAADIRSRFEIDLPPTFEADYRARLLEKFETSLLPIDGIFDVLDGLSVKCCVATSSSPERAARSLAITGLVTRFEGRVFTASEVRNGKPAPDLFLHAAARMGAAPGTSLVIEDSLPGVAAAEAAGMDVLRFTGGSHLMGRRLKHADHVTTFDSWSDLFVLKPDLGGARTG